MEGGWIEVKLAIYFVSNITCRESVKDKAKFIEIMGRYNTINNDIKANNYQVHLKKSDHVPAKDEILWYKKSIRSD